MERREGGRDSGGREIGFIPRSIEGINRDSAAQAARTVGGCDSEDMDGLFAGIGMRY